MNQKLSDWASIAEIISGIAVVVTLIVLIIGVRENTESVRASAYADSMDDLNDFQVEVLTDPDALRVWDAYIQRDATELEGLDRQRLNILVLTHFRILENAYFAERYGLVGDEEWRRFDRSICNFFERAEAVDRVQILRSVMTSDFMEHMVTACPQSSE